MKAKSDKSNWAPSRRDFLVAAGLSATQMNSVWSSAMAAETKVAAPAILKQASRAPNILLIVNDQERYFDKLPAGYRLPGKERLMELGTTFTNQQIASCVCTSSRSNIYTGQHIQQTKMFDNLNFPWVDDLAVNMPNIGHMMRKLGYYSAYQGKFHLSAKMEADLNGTPTFIGRDLMDDYGFSDYAGVGDSIGETLGGYLNDQWIAAFTNRWLKERGQSLNEDGTPWFLAVNFVNPHDVMFYNTDLPGEPVQKSKNVHYGIKHEPDYGLYHQQWNAELSPTRKQPWDVQNRPMAHFDFQTARKALVGQFPNEDGRWDRLMNYYLNCMQDVDRHIHSVISEVESLGMLENTIIVRTADHGELAGAHGMHGKGSNAYREQNQVPMHIVHPDVAGGRSCSSLTSHIDIVPALVSMAGGDEALKQEMVDPLKGLDMSGLLSNPSTATVNELREAILYNFNMLIYLDPDYTIEALGLLSEKGQDEGLKEIEKQGLKPDLNNKRGAIRSTFDGRYKFNRYFAPRHHNNPKTMDELTSLNDLELFDHQTDPNEAVNLAADLEGNKDLVLTMNEKMNAIIEREVGVDDGSSLRLDEIKEFGFTKVDI